MTGWTWPPWNQKPRQRMLPDQLTASVGARGSVLSSERGGLRIASYRCFGGMDVKAQGPREIFTSFQLLPHKLKANTTSEAKHKARKHCAAGICVQCGKRC